MQQVYRVWVSKTETTFLERPAASAEEAAKYVLDIISPADFPEPTTDDYRVIDVQAIEEE